MKLKKFHEENPRTLRISSVVLGIVTIVAVGYIIGRSYASYQESKSFKMMEGTFDYFDGSDVYFAFYQNDEQTSTMPRKESGYVYNPSKSNCTNEATLEWNQDEWSPKVTNLTKTKTKCTLHFNQGTNLGEAIFKNETGKTNVKEAKQAIEAKGTPDFSQIATTNDGMFATEDDHGTSYYYRGAVENNYVKFAGYYWRIIRVNGNGSIRLIYNGDKPDQTGSHTGISEQPFNNYGNNPAYVGYMYGNVLNTSYEQTHTNEIDSNIKKMIDKWYAENIYSKGHTSYLSNEIFCNDRSITRGDGYTTDETIIFGPYERLAFHNKRPSLICPQENDKFTATEATIGNKELTYPIGLITADEISMAGAVKEKGNNSFYLYTGQWYWTMSPSIFNSYPTYTDIWTFQYNGFFEGSGVANDIIGVRVVLNLRPDVLITSVSGTSNDPYVV